MLRRRVRCLTVLLVSLLVLGQACMSAAPFIASGETVKKAGNDFVEIAKLYDTLLDQKKVTVEQYRTWKSFGLKFQQSYPLAVQLWESSLKVNDAALEKQTTAIIASLVSELAQFGAVAYQALGR